MTPVRYEVSVFPKTSLVNIYGDGSVVVTHGGCEMGQGLNTKTAQLVAFELGKVFGNNDGIEMSKIKFADTQTAVTPNAIFTGGSTGSEGTAESARRACATLVERLKPVLEGIKKKKIQMKVKQILLSLGKLFVVLLKVLRICPLKESGKVLEIQV